MSAIAGGVDGATGARLRFDVIDARAGTLGLTKGRLAELVGVDQSTMWRYRQGMKPTLDVVVNLSAALGLTIDEITAAGGNPTPAPPPGPSSPAPPPGPRARR